jgi:hypothetical protein
MKITYRMKKQDYLDSAKLRRVLNSQGATLIRLTGLLAVASGVYLSAAALTRTTGTEHPVPYVIAFLAVAFFIVVTDSRILPALVFNQKLKGKEIPEGLIGTHELELLPNYLQISYGGHNFRFRYPAIAGLSNFKKNILLFTITGLLEVIPNEAFLWGVSRQDFLEYLEERAQAFEGQKLDTPVKGFTEFEGMETADQVNIDFSEEDVLHSSLLHNRQTRRKNLKDPVMLGWLAIAIFVAAGSVVGLVDFATKRVALPSIIIAFTYIISLIIAPIIFLRILPPDALAERLAKKALKAEQYPEGFIGKRTIRWNEAGIQYAYGFIAACLNWSTLSAVIEDDQGFYLYQGSNMVLAIPKKPFTETQLSSFRKAADTAGLLKTETK